MHFCHKRKAQEVLSINIASYIAHYIHAHAQCVLEYVCSN